MKKLLKEEKTITTSKKTFVDENGAESVEYYALDRNNVMKRCNKTWWACSKMGETHQHELGDLVDLFGF